MPVYITVLKMKQQISFFLKNLFWFFTRELSLTPRNTLTVVMSWLVIFNYRMRTNLVKPFDGFLSKIYYPNLFSLQLYSS